jgi:c-di-GMP-binding flagellar brake protein YcgR
MENMIEESNSESFFCPIGTEIVLRFEERDVPLKSVLVGLDRNMFLIIRAPKLPGLAPGLMIGSSFKVLFIYDGTIYGFQSKVLMSILSPAPLLFIAYPENMQRHELRKDFRMNCSIPVAIAVKDGMELGGLITNLSLGGCRATVANDPLTTAHFSIDGAFELSSEMLGIGRDHAIRGIIKNLSQDKKKIHLGFQFEDVDTSALEKIRLFLNQVLDIIH